MDRGQTYREIRGADNCFSVDCFSREIESFPQQNPKLNRITLMCANAIKAFNVHFIGIIGPISTRADSN